MESKRVPPGRWNRFKNHAAGWLAQWALLADALVGVATFNLYHTHLNVRVLVWHSINAEKWFSEQ